MKILYVKGLAVLLDDDDFEKVKDMRWCLKKGKKNQFYVFYYERLFDKPNHRVSDYREIYLHNFLFTRGADRQIVVDHINRDPLDNRRCNLRVCSMQQNGWNRGRSRNNKSGYTGITKRGGKWIAHARINGKLKILGSSSTLSNVLRIYNYYISKERGEFAVIHPIAGVDPSLWCVLPEKKREKISRGNNPHRNIVWDHTRRKWDCRFTHQNKLIRVGRFDSVQEAQIALKEKLKELKVD